MNFLVKHQLDIMQFMCGMCGILTIMTMITRSLPRKTKMILVSMEFSAMMLLFFDRFSYIYKGDMSELGFYMVRFSNGMVYFLSLLIPFLVTRYLADLFFNEAELEKTPVQLKVADLLFAVGLVLLLAAPFTGLYYTFDEQNNYQRAPLNMLCYVAPVLIVLLQEWAVIQNRKRIKRKLAYSIIVCIALPTIASIFQFFFYGVSLINMTTAFVVCIFYTYSLSFLNEIAERAKAREIEAYKTAQKNEAVLFEQTTEALANAIDAKDNYTRGHSTRVAIYSRRIAKRAGLSERDCNRVYFAALLHDIGKIGIKSDIINKIGKLTDEEYQLIKSHSVLGSKILSSIKNAPFLSVGARYHHERYDGKGYPDGLAGTKIPEIARIIAVADSYDAMTSNRSYRKALKKEVAREELKQGAGTQFDPHFAIIMINLIDEGWIEAEKVKNG